MKLSASMIASMSDCGGAVSDFSMMVFHRALYSPPFHVSTSSRRFFFG